MRRGFGILMVFIAVALISTAYNSEHHIQQTRDPERLSISYSDLLKEVNKERAKYGVAPLVEDPRLDQSAQDKANDEVARNYYDHTNPDGVMGVTLAEAAMNHENAYYDENLAAMSPGHSPNTYDIIQSWFNSKPHHDGIIDKHYTLTGFGMSGKYVVEHFYGPADTTLSPPVIGDCQAVLDTYNSAVTADNKQYNMALSAASGQDAENFGYTEARYTATHNSALASDYSTYMASLKANNCPVN